MARFRFPPFPLRHVIRFPLPSAAILALVLLSGCASSPTLPDGRLRHKDFAVKGSALDFVEFLYLPAPGSRRIPHPCRLELHGTGLARLRTGPSPQVRDDFAADPSDPHWNDLVQEQMAITPDQMRGVLQVFVDEGLVPDPPPRDAAEPPLVRYNGKVNMEQFFVSTSNRRLVETLEDFLETNFAPALRRSAVFRPEEGGGR